MAFLKRDLSDEVIEVKTFNYVMRPDYKSGRNEVY
jgi:hypothetical protein